MDEIKPLWKNHPLSIAGKIELVPTEWVYQYRGEDVSPNTTLMDGTIVDLDALWRDICTEGLHDPLIMRVGIQNKMMRLEAGNHRIQIFQQHHLPFVPLVVQLRDECGPHAGEVMNDATHNFDARDELLLSHINEEYVKPSDAFKSCQKQIL